MFHIKFVNLNEINILYRRFHNCMSKSIYHYSIPRTEHKKL